MKKLELDDGKTIYEFDEDATFEKYGKTFNFISLRKISAYKENKKYQNLTVSTKDWNQVKAWLLEHISGETPDKTPF